MHERFASFGLHNAQLGTIDMTLHQQYHGRNLLNKRDMKTQKFGYYKSLLDIAGSGLLINYSCISLRCKEDKRHRLVLTQKARR